MGTWFWLNIPLMLLFFGCWAGIPLWHTLHRWNDEINAKHAELAAKAVPVPVPAPVTAPVPAALGPATTAADETGSPAYAGAAIE
jgi:hypothetical protein